MKKLAVLALFLLLIPSAFAVVANTFQVPMQSNLITQGYEFARVQGFNHNDVPMNILHWHLRAELGPSYAICEMQPAPLLPGPFDVDITVQCQTRSQFTTLFPTGSNAVIEAFTPDGVPVNFNIAKIWIETRPQVPTAIPISTIGHAVLDEQATKAGSFMFFAGMGAIVLVAIAVILFSRREEE